MRLSFLLSTAILAASAIAAASAQTSVDRTFKAAGEDCRDVEWSQEILREYPGIGAACQSVERRAGKTYVKFQGAVKEVIDQGRRIRIDFRQGDTLTLAPPANAALYLDGLETPVSKLRNGMKLNFYVPEDQLTAQFFADDSASKTVVVPIVSEQAVASEQSQPAQAKMERQNVAALELPSTGSNLPLVAWFGLMFIVAGASATILHRWLGR
jgi:LPXTG-motif cell wall-anchored protein